MTLARRLQRIERVTRRAACPLCAHGGGVRRVVVCLDGEKPTRAMYACPSCDAAPETVRVVHIQFDAPPIRPQHAPQDRDEQRRVVRFLSNGPPDSPRARALRSKPHPSKPHPSRRTDAA